MKSTLTSLFFILTFAYVGAQGCSVSSSNLTEISGDDGSGNCTYTIDILFTEGNGPDNRTLTFSSNDANIVSGAGPHSCACSGTTYTITFQAACESTVSFTADHDNSGNGSDCTVTTDNILLPVTWLAFDLREEKDGIVGVYWSTAAEVNNDFFQIEISKEGKYFETVGTLKGAGNSQKQSDYSFSHRHDLAGQIYYRLKQTDFNGNYSYSNIRNINIERTGAFTIAPNPAQETLSISRHKEGMMVHITDISGRKIISTSKSQIGISALSAGLYFVVIEDGDFRQTQQLIKN